MRKMKMQIGRMFALVAISVTTVGMMSACSSGMAGGTNIVGGTVDFSQGDLTEKPFTKIEVETVADVYYTQNNGDKQGVRFDYSQIKDERTRRQFQEKVVAVYREGKLVIGLKGMVMGSNSLNKGQRLRVYITSPDLVKATLEGVGSFNADAINSDVFDINNEGVGNVTIKNLLANKVGIDNEGVGSVSIGSLQSDNVSVGNEGVGNVNIAQFKGGQLMIDNEGVGKVEAHVDCQSIHATLEGVGNIRLSGVTHHFTKTKEGIGSFKDSDLKVLK